MSGGSPPYTFAWSNGASTEDVTGLPSGYYKFSVTDALNESASADITLVEPEQLKLAAEPYKYPSGHNISCHDCYNGSIDVSVFHGVPPYSYTWGDEVYTQDRSGLGALSYAVVVTDANGCEARSEKLLLTQPERKDWTMEGNANTNPGQHFFGTTDAQDVVFKSNGQEALRLLSDGRIKVGGNAIGFGPLHLGADGILRGGGFPEIPPLVSLCYELGARPYWETRGNDLSELCPDAESPKLGTLNGEPLRIITNGQERIHIGIDGRVGIGTYPPVGPVEEYRLYVEDGIATRDVLVKLGPWPDFVFHDTYRLLPFDELRAFVKRHSHLPGIPSASEVETKGGVEVGDLQRRMLETIEQQALYILQLEERVKRLEAKSGI
ncbi:MAG TPA: SprB repeat-containing protein, partial [Flavobacteriales bacterium]|nr:SprB repeat-containing protein [Flavobacteriales bacterium]